MTYYKKRGVNGNSEKIHVVYDLIAQPVYDNTVANSLLHGGNVVAVYDDYYGITNVAPEIHCNVLDTVRIAPKTFKEFQRLGKAIDKKRKGNN